MALSRVAATPPQGLFPSISPILQAKAPRSDRRRKAVQMSVQGNGGAVAEQVVFTPDGHLAKPMKLSAVVTDAVRRWYLEAERDAQRGDVKAQALQGQMLMEGYGCQVDTARGRDLAEKARRRGYRMQGVYCEL